MSALEKYSWEVTHGAAIVGVIITLTVAIHLIGTPRIETHPPAKTTRLVPQLNPLASGATLRSHPLAPPSSQHSTAHSDPHEVIVGANSISNRYKLLSVDRKPRSSTLDYLTVKLHVESLAIEPLVSPFESDMFELRGDGLEPIHPHSPFRAPLPSGSSRNQEIVFSIPSGLNLNHATLQIQYYNYQNEIPLDLPGLSVHSP